MYYRYKNLRLCRRIRDLGHGGLHLLPTRRPQRLPQATFRHLPMWLGGRDLTLPCFRQTKDAFTSVLSRPDVDPTLPPQQGQSAGERCAVHGKAGTQRLLVRLANNAEGGQQTKLGDFDVGLAEFLVVDPRDESCETAKILTSAKEWKKCICAMNAVNWPIHNSMYIHLISRRVKQRGRLGTVKMENQLVLGEWNLVSRLSPAEFDKELYKAGWQFFYIPPEVREYSPR